MNGRFSPLTLAGMTTVSLIGLSIAACQPADTADKGDAAAGMPSPAAQITPSAASAPSAQELAKLGELAREAADSRGDQGALAIMLTDLEKQGKRLSARLPAPSRQLLEQDLQSIRDAVAASDWRAAQDTARAMAGRIKTASGTRAPD